MTRRLKYLSLLNDGGTWGDDPTGEDDVIVLRSTDQTVEGGWRISDPAVRSITVSELDAKRLRAGDLLITKSSGSDLHIGKASLVDESIERLGAVFSNFNQRIRLVSGQESRFW